MTNDMKTIQKYGAKAALASFAILLATAFTACDAHKDFPDTSMQPCHVLCTDGKVVPLADCQAQGKQPIAVVFHVNHNEDIEGNGYAVYLWDIDPVAFADSIGVSQGTSADLTAYDGNTNTFALYGTTEVHSPLAEKVFDIWRYGQSAYIPSVAQMRLLFHAKETVNPVIEACGGTPLPDTPDDCWYWTSTEVSGQQTAKAWLYSVGSGAMQETPKTQSHKARAIITLNE